MSENPVLVECLDDGALVPVGEHGRRAFSSMFSAGNRYRIVPVEERSAVSHRHYFACIREAWNNMPEHMADQYPTPEHLRKKMLIRAGFADERSIVCSTKAEAERVAAFVRPLDDYAVVIFREAVVKVFTAQSQSAKAMGKKAFQESKEAVLDAIADLIGVDPSTLKDNAGKAA